METVIIKKKKLETDTNAPTQYFKELEAANVTCQRFLRWLHSAKPGEVYCYHTGQWLDGQLVGRTVRRAYDKGQVTLIQKRSANGFDYLAARRRED